MFVEWFLFQQSSVIATLFLLLALRRSTNSLQQLYVLDKSGSSIANIQLMPYSSVAIASSMVTEQLLQGDDKFSDDSFNVTNLLSVNKTEKEISNENATEWSVGKAIAAVTMDTPHKKSATTVQIQAEKSKNTLAAIKTTTAPVQTTTTNTQELLPKNSTRSEEQYACKKYKECELYQMLENFGDLNQLFMANSPEEAGRNFARNLMHTDFEQQPNRDDISKVFFDQPLNDSNCGWSCLLIKETLIRWLNDTNSEEGSSSSISSSENTRKFHDDISDNGLQNVDSKNPCKLEKFVPVGNCTLRGKEEISGYEKLCSSCHGVYILSQNCFPRFLNSVTCDNDDGKCIFHKISKAYGKCNLRTLSFGVLYNSGTIKCEQWTRVYIDVPIACECYLGVNPLGLSATGIRQ